MLQLIEKIHVYFHLDISIKHTTPAQGGTELVEILQTKKDFGVQHLLMMIQIWKTGVFVMTCVHLKVQFRFPKEAKKISSNNICGFL